MDSAELEVHFQRCKQLFTQGQHSKCLRKLSEIPVHKFSGLSLVLEHNQTICGHMTRVTCRAKGGRLFSLQTDGTGVHPLGLDGDTRDPRQTDRDERTTDHTLRMSPVDPDMIEINNQTFKTLNGISLKLQGLQPQGAILELECATTYNMCYLHLLDWVHYQASNGSSAVSTAVLGCLRRVSKSVGEMLEVSDAQDEHSLIMDHISNILRSRYSEGTLNKAVFVILIYILHRLITHGTDPRLLEVLENVRLHIEHLKPLQYLYTFSLVKTQDVNSVTYLEDTTLVTIAVALYKCGQYNRCVEVLSKGKCDTLSSTAVYIRGCALYQLNKYDQCIECLEQVINDVDLPTLAGKSVILSGCCLSMQGFTQSAVQYFQRALHLDPTDPCALHNIAAQYRRLGLHEAEHDTLEILNKALEKGTVVSKSMEVTLDLASLLIRQVHPFERISQAEALYMSATRYCELNRFEDASEKYLDLISVMMTDGSNAKQLGLKILPQPVIIFHEAAKALLQCGRHDDVVTLCDQLLDSHDPLAHSMTPSQSQSLPGSVSRDPATLSGRKRERSATDDQDQGGQSVGEEEEWWTAFPQDVIALKYKAEALFNMRDHDTALTCLTRLTYLLENHSPSMINDQSAAPATKRPRLGSDANAKGDNHLVAFTVDVYTTKAIIQERIGKVNCALYSTQCALSLNPENIVAVFAHCLLLLSQDKKDDALRLWTRARDIEVRHMDSLHLDRLLERKRNQIKSRTSGLPKMSTTEPTEEEKILLDIACLQHAQESSLKRRKLFSK